MAPSVRGTVGVDMVTEAVEDAKKNAALNELANTQFFAGKAEKVLWDTPNIVKNLEKKFYSQKGKWVIDDHNNENEFYHQ